MTRSERINKLAGAIKRYKGAHTQGPRGTIRWIRSPQPGAVKDILKWVESLNLPLRESMIEIEGFKTKSEFDHWMRGII